MFKFISYYNPTAHHLMTLFNRLNPNDINVRVNYGKGDVCGTGPFMWIRNHKAQISQFIDPETLIEYLRPPLKFKWRRILFYWILAIIAFVACATITFIIIVNKQHDKAKIDQMTYTFLGIIFCTTVIQFVGIFLCLQNFQKQLCFYIQQLNEKQMNYRGIQLYYSEGCCWGKNINVLGIRKIDPTIGYIQEDPEQ